MYIQEAREEYLKALKAGYKEFKETPDDHSAYPAVLDAILPQNNSDAYQDVGLVEIPAERIIGVRSAGRITAFTRNFTPLLDLETEFANKWIGLCAAHLSDEGIREPILCYEYMGWFYVQEGNKRVSVLRHFGAPRITGNVRRILPPESDDPATKVYYEFLEFFKGARLYDIQFQNPGDYAKLLSALGKERGELWSDWDRRTFCAYLQYFREAFASLTGGNAPISCEEALLLWLEVYSFRDIGRLTAPELKKALATLWKDLKAIAAEEPVEVSTAPAEKSASIGDMLSRLIQPAPEHLHVAFVHPLDPEVSVWVRGHERGREHLEKVLGDRITVSSYFHADSPEQADALLEQAVAEGARMVFTTTPQLSRATLRCAIKYPKVRFLNCSVDVPYSSIRAYYSRIFEAKFITGAIAGAMANNDYIGYIGSYPIYGVPASINAFALGAQMTNPRAKIDLRWSCLPGNPVKDFAELGYEVISNRDVPTPDRMYLEFGEYGTYFIGEDGHLTPLASPCWLWGTFYEKVVRSVLDGTWENHRDSRRALSYWWGMDSGVIDVELSDQLPPSMQFLANTLRRGLKRGMIDPFARRIVAQDGTVKNDGRHCFTPDELIHMDWLCDNVEGFIPEFDQVQPFAQAMVRELGLHRELIPREKEVDAL